MGIAKVKDGAQLSCKLCHQPDERGQYLLPVSSPERCAACHPLDFDGRFPDAVVPHDTPAIVTRTCAARSARRSINAQAIPAGEAGKAVRARCVELELAKAPRAAGGGDRPAARRTPERGRGAPAASRAAADCADAPRSPSPRRHRS